MLVGIEAGELKGVYKKSVDGVSITLNSVNALGMIWGECVSAVVDHVGKNEGEELSSLDGSGMGMQVGIEAGMLESVPEGDADCVSVGLNVATTLGTKGVYAGEVDGDLGGKIDGASVDSLDGTSTITLVGIDTGVIEGAPGEDAGCASSSSMAGNALGILGVCVGKLVGDHV